MKVRALKLTRVPIAIRRELPSLAGAPFHIEGHASERSRTRESAMKDSGVSHEGPVGRSSEAVSDSAGRRGPEETDHERGVEGVTGRGRRPAGGSGTKRSAVGSGAAGGRLSVAAGTLLTAGSASTLDTKSMAILGKCLDDPGGNVSDGTHVNMYSCNKGANQEWFIESDGTIRPSADSNMCLDLPA
jgi:hypothetical protein